MFPSASPVHHSAASIPGGGPLCAATSYLFAAIGQPSPRTLHFRTAVSKAHRHWSCNGPQRSAPNCKSDAQFPLLPAVQRRERTSSLPQRIRSCKLLACCVSSQHTWVADRLLQLRHNALPAAPTAAAKLYTLFNLLTL